MKKLFTIFFLVLVASVGTMFAESGTCGDNLTWDLTDGVLTISGTGAMSYSVRPWTTYKNYIKTISLPNGITSICAGAFSGCTNLSEITLPASLETIEADAFAGCTNLKKVYNYSPYLVIVKGDWNNGEVGMYADEIYNMVEEYTGTCGANLTWKVNIRDSVLTISGTGAMAYYTSYAETPWYALSLYIKIAVIEEGVTNLSNKAFPDHYYNDDYSYKSYYIPQIVHNYSPLYISNGSGNVSDIFYIYYAQEIHNYYTRTGNCGDGLSWSYTDGVLTISGEGELDYTRYSSTPWHNYAIDTVVVLAEDVYVSDILFPTAAQIIIGENVHRITIGLGFDKVIALSDQTIISLISNLWPFDETQYYDMDGNGDKEMMQIVSNRISGQNYFCDVNVYSTLTGTLVTDTLHPVTAYSSNFSMLYYLNANNDGKMDMVYYYQTTSGEPYKLELIESTNEGYVAKPIDALYSQTKKLPFFPLDANLDGKMDFYSCEGDYAHYIHYRQPDGSYMKVPLQIITDTAKLDDTTKQWMNSDAYLKGSYLFEITQGAYSIVGEVVKGPFQYIDTPIDINNDGLVDLLSSTKGALLLNIGNNRFIPSQAPGRVIPKDLNGDGILDYVLFDDETNTISTKIYTESGIVSRTLVQNANISNVWCYDFDNDGDMDILLPFDWNESSGYAYLVFFRNDGNNTFKKIENAFDEPIRHFYFYDCKDVDNDGKYEILALDSVQIHYSGIYNNNIEKPIYDGNSYIIHYDNNMNVSVDEQPLFANTIESQNLSISDATSYINSRGVYPLPLIADFNNDGALDYWYYYKGSSALSHFNPTNLNTAPQKMVTPSAILNDNQKMLTINWSRGSDLESPSADLMYNLRIGSSSGKGDVWFAAANADGKQRDILGGNVGGNVSQKVNTAAWETGDYYIAVQAVDPNGLGGAWSDELIYHHTAIPSQFEISDYEMTTADTLFVRLSTAINPDYTYNWNFGDSVVIISQNGQDYQISYYTAGVKTISLQVISSNGIVSPVTNRQVQVYPVKFERMIEYGYYSLPFGSYIDLNMDGDIDQLKTYKSSYAADPRIPNGFYKGNGDGTFTKLAKTYNSDLEPEGRGAMCFFDYNMDGLPDVLRTTNKGNLMINEDNFDMEFESHDFLRLYQESSELTTFTYYYDKELIDFNNDGYMDFLYNMDLYRYGVNFFGRDTIDTWCESSLDVPHAPHFGYYAFNKFYIDLNNDGLLDALLEGDDINDYYIYLQQTNGDFIEYTHTNSLSDFSHNFTFADFNNDGYQDIITIMDSQTIRIYLGDHSLRYTNFIDIVLPSDFTFASDTKLYANRDIDNNGYIDINCSSFIIYGFPDNEILCQYAPSVTYPFIDMDSDGVPDFDNYFMRSRITNEAPAIPQNLQMVEENGAVKLMWNAAVDRETPAAQMRYNISVKKKNAQAGEENAFIISPMNGLYDEAAVIPDYPYKRGTQIFIPYKRFVFGQEYEFQIQAIDAWNAHSPMSAPISFTVEKNTTYNPNQPTSLPIMEQEIVKPQKIMIDGVIYILRGDKTYTLQGQEVK